MEFANPAALAITALAIPLAIHLLRRPDRTITVAYSAGLVGLRPRLRLRLARWLPLAGAIAFIQEFYDCSTATPTVRRPSATKAPPPTRPLDSTNQGRPPPPNEPVRQTGATPM